MAGVLTPEEQRLKSLEQVIRSQIIEEQSDMELDPLCDLLYEKIYEENEE
jgi:hypothetical protein